MTLKNKIDGIKEIWQFENRWQLLFNRLFFGGENINIYRYKNFEILTDHSAGDANGAREVLTTDMYRSLFSDINLEGKINVLDLGANNGGFALLIESEKFDVKKIVCVEFNPDTFSRLQFNIARNISCEYELINAAVCGKNQQIIVRFGEASTSDNIYENNSKDKSSINSKIVEGLTLNEIYQRNFKNEKIDLCKIDVEGAEYELFNESAEDFLENCRNLIIEIHHQENRPRNLVIEKLEKAGFEENGGEDKTDTNLHYVHLFVNKKLI